MRLQFDWDPAKALSNIGKHRVTFEEAMTVFQDQLARSIIDPDSADEERWVTLGLSSFGTCLVVVHTWTDLDPSRSAVRIISARRASRTEARQYRESPQP